LKPYDAKLLRIFAAEQAEHLERIWRAAESLTRAGGAERAPLFDELLRRAHTLKGAARAVGIDSTERLAHGIEAMFGRIRAGTATPDEQALGALRHALDSAEDIVTAAASDRSEPEVTPVLEALERAGRGSPTPLPPAPPPEPAQERPPQPEPELVRVATELIDDVVRASSRLISTAAAAGGDARKADASEALLRELEGAWRQVRRASAGYEKLRRDGPNFAPVLDAMNAVEDRLRAVSADSAASASARRRRAWELAEGSRELHANARRIRMITADGVFSGFGPMVRDMARAEGKQVDFRSEGLHVQADRLVLQGLKDAVMHLLRNAVTHGIELPRDRENAGKPPAGTVSLRLRTRGDRLEITVEDDGRGLDLRRIAAVAVVKGLLAEEQAVSLTAAEAARLICRPGFSTATDVTALAGRGMGLSVVREAVGAMGGELSVRPAPRFGTAVEISAPLSISTQRILLVRSAGHVIGMATAAVERVWRGNSSEIQNIDGREAIVPGGSPILLARLSDLLELAPASGAPADQEPPSKLHVAVLVSGGERAGLLVDSFIDDLDATVLSLGLPAPLAGISAGGVALEDGTVAVIIDPAALMDRFRGSGASTRIAATLPEAKPKPRILVVDDSLTTRSLEKSILEAHGYDVRVAVDGIQALEELRAGGADLVITDVMMPRMDGLELLEKMKSDKSLAAIPVIVVTSLEKREEQERGLSLGADAYIVKRKFDQRELLNIVRQIL
jgi:two-component system chemotaxis sensor kinase CheA